MKTESKHFEAQFEADDKEGMWLCTAKPTAPGNLKTYSFSIFGLIPIMEVRHILLAMDGAIGFAMQSN